MTARTTVERPSDPAPGREPASALGRWAARCYDHRRAVVFLLSRIREGWLQTGDNSLAVADGLAVTGRVITAAAAIMFCVFASFVIKDPLHILKVFGLGLAVAVAIDVTLVRMVLVPSLMELLGPRNWWMPRVLQRCIPAIGAEVTPPPVPTHAWEGEAAH